MFVYFKSYCGDVWIRIIIVIDILYALQITYNLLYKLQFYGIIKISLKIYVK